MMLHEKMLLGVLVLASFAVGCAEPERAARAEDEEEELTGSSGGFDEVEVEEDEVLAAIDDYTNRLLPMDDQAEVSETHADAAEVQVWVSPEAAETFASIDPDDPSQAVAFPEGSVLVKEHYDAEGNMFGLNVMYKAPFGYAPEDGDWYWMQVRGDAVTHAGRVSFCVDCHAAAINSDFVVGFGKSQ